MGLRSEADARRISSERERFERECATPKDDWEGNEKGYINYLSKIPTSSRDKNGNLITLMGEAGIREHLADHLDNKDCCSYHQDKYQGYYKWMKLVRKKFEKMVNRGEFDDFDYKQTEREDIKCWKRYYDNNPQFTRPRGI